MLNFCNFIQVYVFTTNHHLKLDTVNILHMAIKVSCRWGWFRNAVIVLLVAVLVSFATKVSQ